MKEYRPIAVAAAIGMVAALIAGCSQSVSALETRSPPQPLPSVPLEPVEVAPLDPAVQPGAQGGDPVALTQDPAIADDGTQMASTEPMAPAEQGSAPAGGGEPLSREALAGTWTVNSDNPDCRIILAFTKWSGGYRAATRRCNSAELGAVSAWDVRDNSVVLVDGNGQTVASLYSAGPERYDGSTNGGMRIALTR